MRVFASIQSRVPGFSFSRRIRSGRAGRERAGAVCLASCLEEIAHPENAETAPRPTAPLSKSRRVMPAFGCEWKGSVELFINLPEVGRDLGGRTFSLRRFANACT